MKTCKLIARKLILVNKNTRIPILDSAGNKIIKDNLEGDPDYYPPTMIEDCDEEVQVTTTINPCSILVKAVTVDCNINPNANIIRVEFNTVITGLFDVEITQSGQVVLSVPNVQIISGNAYIGLSKLYTGVTQVRVIYNACNISNTLTINCAQQTTTVIPLTTTIAGSTTTVVPLTTTVQGTPSGTFVLEELYCELPEVTTTVAPATTTLAGVTTTVAPVTTTVAPVTTTSNPCKGTVIITDVEIIDNLHLKATLTVPAGITLMYWNLYIHDSTGTINSGTLIAGTNPYIITLTTPMGSGSIYDLNVFAPDCAEGGKFVVINSGTTVVPPVTTTVNPSPCSGLTGLVINYRGKAGTAAPYDTREDALFAACFGGAGCTAYVDSIALGKIVSKKTSGVSCSVASCQPLENGWYWIYPSGTPNDVHVIHVTSGVIDTLIANPCDV